MTQIQTLKIENYKGFYGEQRIDFAIPDQQKNGSGLTLIVGPNNTGKTTIIEALAFSERNNFDDYDRHNNDDPKITHIFFNNKAITYTNIKKGSKVKKISNFEEEIFEFDLIEARRNWINQTDTTIDIKRFLEVTRYFNQRNLEGY